MLTQNVNTLLYRVHVLELYVLEYTY